MLIFDTTFVAEKINMVKGCQFSDHVSRTAATEGRANSKEVKGANRGWQDLIGSTTPFQPTLPESLVHPSNLDTELSLVDAVQGALDGLQSACHLAHASQYDP